MKTDYFELKSNVEKLAKQEGITELESITLLQSAAAIVNDENLLDALCNLKNEFLFYAKNAKFFELFGSVK